MCEPLRRARLDLSLMWNKTTFFSSFPILPYVNELNNQKKPQPKNERLVSQCCALESNEMLFHVCKCLPGRGSHLTLLLLLNRINNGERAEWIAKQPRRSLADSGWVPSLNLLSLSSVSRGGFARCSSDAERWALWVKGNLRVNLDNPPEPAARNYIWSFFSPTFLLSRDDHSEPPQQYSTTFVRWSTSIFIIKMTINRQ